MEKKKRRELLRNLRKHFPAPHPVKVWHSTAKKNFGAVRFDGQKFLMRINESALPIYQRDALVHEWAHCLAGWNENTEPHTPAWGIVYAAIYSAWMNDFKGTL